MAGTVLLWPTTTTTRPACRRAASATARAWPTIPATVIAERIGWLHDDPDALRGLSERGQAAFLRVFDVDAQLAPRLRILSELLDSPT